MSTDPGARLTRAERILLRVVDRRDRAKECYSEMMDEWEKTLVTEDMTKREYDSRLRAVQREDGPVGRAWRARRRWMRWGRVMYFAVRRYKREYHDAREFGTGG